MAFKLRSPLHIEPKLPVANDGSDKFKNYQAGLKKTYMSSKDSGVGAYPDPQTGERTFYDKKHQSYDMKTGVTNKTGSLVAKFFWIEIYALYQKYTKMLGT